MNSLKKAFYRTCEELELGPNEIKMELFFQWAVIISCAKNSLILALKSMALAAMLIVLFCFIFWDWKLLLFAAPYALRIGLVIWLVLFIIFARDAQSLKRKKG